MPALLIKTDIPSEELRRLASREDDARVARRLLALASALDGTPRAAAAKAAGMDTQTLRDWVIRYNRGGATALVDAWGDGRPCRLSEGEQAMLKAMVLTGPDPEVDGMSAWRITDICRLVEQRFDVTYSVGGMGRRLRALDLSFQTCRPQHPKSDPAAQKAFKRKFWRVLDQIAAEHAEAEHVEVWFQDEIRVGQKGRVTRRWYQRGERPRMVKDLGYSSAYIFGAVCPERDTGVAIVLPRASTEGMNLLLEELSSDVPVRTHALVLIDNAGWHVSEELKVPANMTLVPLPAYSPELNAIEKVWQYLRERYLSGRLFTSVAAVIEACCKVWNALLAETGRIRSIAYRKWAAPVKP